MWRGALWVEPEGIPIAMATVETVREKIAFSSLLKLKWCEMETFMPQKHFQERRQLDDVTKVVSWKDP